MIGSDPEGRLGEAPRPELREHGRISGACFDAARGIVPGLKVNLPFLCFSVFCFLALPFVSLSFYGEVVQHPKAYMEVNVIDHCRLKEQIIKQLMALACGTT